MKPICELYLITSFTNNDENDDDDDDDNNNRLKCVNIIRQYKHN